MSKIDTLFETLALRTRELLTAEDTEGNLVTRVKADVDVGPHTPLVFRSSAFFVHEEEVAASHEACLAHRLPEDEDEEHGYFRSALARLYIEGLKQGASDTALDGTVTADAFAGLSPVSFSEIVDNLIEDLQALESKGAIEARGVPSDVDEVDIGVLFEAAQRVFGMPRFAQRPYSAFTNEVCGYAFFPRGDLFDGLQKDSLQRRPNCYALYSPRGDLVLLPLRKLEPLEPVAYTTCPAAVGHEWACSSSLRELDPEERLQQHLRHMPFKCLSFVEAEKRRLSPPRLHGTLLQEQSFYASEETEVFDVDREVLLLLCSMVPPRADPQNDLYIELAEALARTKAKRVAKDPSLSEAEARLLREKIATKFLLSYDTAYSKSKDFDAPFGMALLLLRQRLKDDCIGMPHLDTRSDTERHTSLPTTMLTIASAVGPETPFSSKEGCDLDLEVMRAALFVLGSWKGDPLFLQQTVMRPYLLERAASYLNIDLCDA